VIGNRKDADAAAFHRSHQLAGREASVAIRRVAMEIDDHALGRRWTARRIAVRSFPSIVTSMNSGTQTKSNSLVPRYERAIAIALTAVVGRSPSDRLKLRGLALAQHPRQRAATEF
jgi:hypothetical protein